MRPGGERHSVANGFDTAILFKSIEPPFRACCIGVSEPCLMDEMSLDMTRQRSRKGSSSMCQAISSCHAIDPIMLGVFHSQVPELVTVL